ncbi:MAG: hypothetical protein H6765_10450 [Candidatus Peribacteria bacterium]|nr:MAG: hypothetical protein H6765_10450 [Candidatus Peribacteria bacterium]
MCPADTIVYQNLGDLDTAKRASTFVLSDNNRKLSVQNDIQLMDTVEEKKRVFIGVGTQIGKKQVEPIQIQDISLREVTTEDIAAFDGKFAGGIEFGIEGKNLLFTKPVQITFPVVGVADGEIIPVYVKHDGNAEYSQESLTNDPDAQCVQGIPNAGVPEAEVIDGTVTFWSCQASTFAAGGTNGSLCTVDADCPNGTCVE